MAPAILLLRGMANGVPVQDGGNIEEEIGIQHRNDDVPALLDQEEKLQVVQAHERLRGAQSTADIRSDPGRLHHGHIFGKKRR